MGERLTSLKREWRVGLVELIATPTHRRSIDLHWALAPRPCVGHRVDCTAEAKDLPEGTDIGPVAVNDRNVDAEVLQELEVSAADEAPANLIDFDAVIARL